MAAEKRETARRELDEAILAFRLARTAGGSVDGWVRSVRQAVGLPVGELARRLGVKRREVFRLESSERNERIGLGKLRKAAEALNCVLVYGVVPREGTLAEMAAGQAAALKEAREQARQKKQMERERQKPDATSVRQMLGKAIRRALRKKYGIRIRRRKPQGWMD